MTQDRRFPTWKTIAGLLITALWALSFWLFTDTRAEVKRLDRDKVDYAQYESDIKELKQTSRDIYKMLYEHDRRK